MAMRMPEALKVKGICGVCALCEDCELATRSAAPMTHCEQLEPDHGLVSEMVRFVMQGQVSKMTDAVEHMGLCMNCEHHNDCTFPRDQGGVWYCEEYE